jgi:dynein heavy chain
MDPVLEKQFILRGNKKKLQFGDQLIDFSDHFTLFMTSRLGNPRFSPELAAKTTIIDFTVTLLGLEQQLLGRVISKEKRTLEESLQAIMEDITMNTKTLLQYDKALLERLTSTTGNLLDDIELIEVLNATKAKSKEVHQKLVEADEKQKDISEKREQYRRIATRGSILYFVVVEMSLVNWMYNTSLGQFLVKFDEAIDKADKNVIAESKKIENIENKLTYVIFRYINKGLFVKDKLTFVLMVCLKILVTAGKLNQADIALLLRSGFSLDAKTEKPNPFQKWIQNEQSWLNILALSRHHYGREGIGFFRELPESIQRADDKWKEWYAH